MPNTYIYHIHVVGVSNDRQVSNGACKEQHYITLEHSTCCYDMQHMSHDLSNRLTLTLTLLLMRAPHRIGLTVELWLYVFRSESIATLLKNVAHTNGVKVRCSTRVQDLICE